MSRPSNWSGEYTWVFFGRRHQGLLEQAGEHLDQTANGRDEENPEDQQPRVLFQLFM